MIVIITANSYFASGITSLAMPPAAAAYSCTSAVAVFSDLATITEDYLHSAKTIVIDYSHPNIQHLASLLAQKNKYISGDIIFVVKRIYFSILLRILLSTHSQAWYWSMPVPRNACALISGILTRIPSAIRLNKPLCPSIATFI